jgi:hypothetical protein
MTDAQGHGVMRPALDVMNAIFPQFRFESRSSAPACVLAPLIGKHLLGHTVLCYRAASYSCILGLGMGTQNADGLLAI